MIKNDLPLDDWLKRCEQIWRHTRFHGVPPLDVSQKPLRIRLTSMEDSLNEIQKRLHLLSSPELRYWHEHLEEINEHLHVLSEGLKEKSGDKVGQHECHTV
jgi:hypothetical protein